MVYTVAMQDAANYAYEGALAPIHPYAVRTAVWAGMYILPTRQAFLESIGETEDSARELAAQFVAGSPEVEKTILALYDSDMPASDVIPASMFSTSWWGTPATPAPQQA